MARWSLLAVLGLLAFVAHASPLPAQRVRPGAVAPAARVVPMTLQPRPVVPATGASAETRRSRARGARYGFVIGAVVGALAGAAFTDDFYDARGVNMAVGAATLGLLGALVGAAVGAPAPSP